MAKRKSSKRKPANGRKSAASEPAAAPVEAAKPAEDAVDFSSLRKIFEEAAKADAGPGLQLVDVQCPYCEEEFEITVDPSESEQEMVQICRSCAHSITFSVEVDEGDVSVSAYQE